MLGKTIAKLRKSKGLTQAKFADMIHVTQGAVSQWETGRTSPDVQQMFILADFFGVTVDALSSGTATIAKPDTHTITPPPAQEKASADDPLTEQIMAKARLMNEEEHRQLLRIMDAVKK